MEQRARNYISWTYLIFIICLTDCKKVITLSLPHTPQLVLHGYVAVGEPFSVTIARPEDPVIPDTALNLNSAWVVLFENGVFKDSLLYHAQQKKYISRSAIAEFDKTYTVRAGAEGFLTAEAMAAAPQPVPTVAIEHKLNARLADNGKFLDDVQFTFRDPAGIKNYYIAALYPSARFGSSLLCVSSADPVIDRPHADALPSGNNTCIDAKRILFNDQSFNGQLKQITISAWPQALQTIKDDSGVVYKPYLKRYTIDREFYKYVKYILSQDFELGIPYLNVAATDIGNVTNGYGLFTIYSVTTDSLP